MTMTCTIAHRKYNGGVDAYNIPEPDEWEETEDVRCLYQTMDNAVVGEEAGRGVEATGRLFFMPSVQIEDGYQVSNIAIGGADLDEGPMEVLRVKTETSPAGAHHKIAMVKQAERCR